MPIPGKPQKKSIRDFFGPVVSVSQSSSKSVSSQRGTPDTSDADAKQVIDAAVSKDHRAVLTRYANGSHSPTVAASETFMVHRGNDGDAHPPIASQASANSGGSKRIVSNGEQVVLDSDSDSDNESLASLDWGVLKNTTETTRTNASITTRSKRGNDDDEDGLRRPQKQRKSGKHSLADVVKTAQRNLELEERIKEHKANLETYVYEPVVGSIVINEQILGQVVEDGEEEPGKAHRLLQAMQRTRATHIESCFHFFGAYSRSLRERPKFPLGSLSKHRWIANFREQNSRDQAFLTGFARQVFRVQELPEELASWMLDEICYGDNGILNANYMDILALRPQYMRNLLDQKRIDAIFHTLGAEVQILDQTTEVNPSTSKSEEGAHLPSSLKAVARLLQFSAPQLRTKTRSRATLLLLFACADDRTLADADVLGSLQDAIEAVICNFADNNKLSSGVRSPPSATLVHNLIRLQLSDVVPQLLSRISHPLLQRSIIRALPYRSPLTSYLRRYLALSFLVYPTPIDVPLAHPTIPKIIHRYLDKSPHMKAGKAANFDYLATRLELLDIAIGPGPLTVPYEPLLNPDPSDDGSSPIPAPAPASSEIKEFNKQVDALAQHIKYLGNSIVEAGAVTDLAILEAKDGIERLCARLEHAVRIGGRKMHDPFGDYDDQERQLKMSRFFTARSKTSTPVPSRGIFEDEDD